MGGFGRTVRRALLAAVVVSHLTGCAVFNEDNRRLLNTMDDAVHPQSTGVQIALAPPGIVVGSAALTVDAFLVHPVSVVPTAWDDVCELYWEPRKYSAIREVMLIVPMAILTPPTFAADWLARSLFEVD